MKKNEEILEDWKFNGNYFWGSFRPKIWANFWANFGPT